MNPHCPKILSIPAVIFPELLGLTPYAITLINIPCSAEVVSSRYNWAADQIEIVLRHLDFDPVPAGEAPPKTWAAVKKRLKPLKKKPKKEILTLLPIPYTGSQILNDSTSPQSSLPADIRDAHRGDVAALAGLLGNAIDFHCFAKYREELAGVITSAAAEAHKTPVGELSWQHLAAVQVEEGAAVSVGAWETIKQAARDELSSGHRAAMVVETHETRPMDRARFLAVREALAGEWHPRGGIEWTLIDQMAQAQAQYLYWTQKLSERSQQEAAEDRRDRQTYHTQEKQWYKCGDWIPERVTTSEAIQEAAGMADRWHRLFMRSLRQLRDLRRFSVVIQNAGQVNLAHQQVNVSKPGAGQHGAVQNRAELRRRFKAKKRRLG